MIDQEGINSLNTGAEPITYEGTEGPKSPEQDQAIAMGIPEGLTVQEAIETFKASEGRDPNNIEEVIKYFKNRTLSEAFPTEEYQIEFERVFPEMIPLRGTDEYNEDLENYFRGLAKGPIIPSDEDPVNPFGPKPMKDLRQMAAFGGIMGLDQRKQYGIGSKFKRALNKVTKPFTKVAQKLVPKELAGPLRTIAPFLPPGYREAAYLAGTAKQKGRFNIGDLAFTAAPYARFSEAAPGQGTFGTDTDFRFGTAQSGDYGIRDLITGGERGGAYEQRGGKGILGKIKLGESDLGQMSDEFIFGKPAQTREITPRQDKYGVPNVRSEAEIQAYYDSLSLAEQDKFDAFETLYDEGNLNAEGISKFQKEILNRPDVTKTMYDSATSGILGMGGEMSVLGGAGGAPGIMKSKAGQTLLGQTKDPTQVSKLKLGSWAIGIVSGIQAGKYANEQAAADAAESQLMATNQAASDAEVQAARDWAIETFNSMSVYADGGRIGFESGTPDPRMMQSPGIKQGLGALGGQQNTDTKTIDMMPDIQILTGSENTIGAQQVYPKDMEIKLMIGDSDRNNLPPLKIDDNRFLFNGIIFNSEEELNEYMLQLMPFKADGGRINKNMGGEFNMPPAGLSSLQTQQSDVTPQGMELDLRGGGFIPIGKAEKADDVPARVSKNEFVFTADAVKAAGGGSVNEGAKRMYDTMKRLESQVG